LKLGPRGPDVGPPERSELVDPLEKTAIGLDANVAAALCYALGWVTGVAFLVMEPHNKFVRFHAMQSTIAFAALSLAWILGLSIPFVGWVFSFFVVTPLSAVVWLVAMFRAYYGERFKLPIAGDMAEQRV
jgi:uncharacterized membrane protein